MRRARSVRDWLYRERGRARRRPCSSPKNETKGTIDAPTPQPQFPAPKSGRRFTSTQVTLIIIVGLIFGSCALCGIVGGIGNMLNPQKPGPAANAPASGASPSPASNQNDAAAAAAPGKYFDGAQACKHLASVGGLELGSYAPNKNTEGYSCDGKERVVKLSCNPASDILCDEVSYSVDGEKGDATNAELSYMGTSLHAASNKKDMQTFIQHANQLSKQALGAETDSEIKQYILNTDKFLPMKPEPDSAALERHALKKKLGSGFVKVFTRRNELPGGTAYFIYFTVYPNERWVQ